MVLVLSALADADAPVRGLCEAASIAGEPEEEGLTLTRLPVAAQPQVGIERRRVDDLAGVHPVIGVHESFEVTKQGDHLVAEHAREELAAGLAVAVLAGERTAIAEDEVGRTV